MNNNNQINWSPNVIIADAEYIDKVAFNLSVNFERMLGRRIPPADLAQWAVCIALDGGTKEATTTQVVLIHDKYHLALENFRPAHYEQDLNAKAFNDPQLGEFILSSFPTEKMVSKDDFLLDVIQTVSHQEQVKRLMIIPDSEQEDSESLIRAIDLALQDVSDDKRVTLFAMQPLAGRNFRQEILGYSVLNALGIRSDELKNKID